LTPFKSKDGIARAIIKHFSFDLRHQTSFSLLQPIINCYKAKSNNHIKTNQTTHTKDFLGKKRPKMAIFQGNQILNHKNLDHRFCHVIKK
jgi:hypothetical protein